MCGTSTTRTAVVPQGDLIAILHPPTHKATTATSLRNSYLTFSNRGHDSSKQPPNSVVQLKQQGLEEQKGEDVGPLVVRIQ